MFLFIFSHISTPASDHHQPRRGVCAGGQLPAHQVEGDQPDWEWSHGSLRVLHRPSPQPGGHRHVQQVRLKLYGFFETSNFNLHQTDEPQFILLSE